MNLSDQLDGLLKHDAGEVLKDGTLLMQMLKIYSQIFLNSKPCSTCEKYHRKYYQRLVNEGRKRLEQQKNNKMALEKYKLKKGVILHVRGEVFSVHNLTDKKAEQILKEFPGMESQFDVIPKKEAPKKKAKTEPKEETKEEPKE